MEGGSGPITCARYNQRASAVREAWRGKGEGGQIGRAI